MPTFARRQAPHSPEFSSDTVRRIADRMLGFLELSEAELSVLLTDDVQIRALNSEHRGKDKATDVLAFPMDDDPSLPATGRVLGDVVISIDTALRQSKKRCHDLRGEITFLLAHGLLHLNGYDHQTDAEEREMTRRTHELVAACGGQAGADGP